MDNTDRVELWETGAVVVVHGVLVALLFYFAYWTVPAILGSALGDFSGPLPWPVQTFVDWRFSFWNRPSIAIPRAVLLLFADGWVHRSFLRSKNRKVAAIWASAVTLILIAIHVRNISLLTYFVVHYCSR